MARKSTPAPSLAASLDFLMKQEAPSVRRELIPAKPGLYWAAFDDGRSFDADEWFDPVPGFGKGPHVVRLSRCPDYGDWMGELMQGGSVGIGEDIKDRRVQLAFPATVAFMRTVATVWVRVTWLGPVKGPDLPDEVEPFPEFL